MRQYQRGFTAVEVLITLFVASILVGGGYQAYGVVMSNSADARERSIASNHAYEALRMRSAMISDTCTASNHNIISTLPTDTALPQPVTMRAIVVCPYGINGPLSRLTITLTYGSPQKEVSHAIFVRPT